MPTLNTLMASSDYLRKEFSTHATEIFAHRPLLQKGHAQSCERATLQTPRVKQMETRH